MPHVNVFEWLDNIDIYIQPSKTEGMPRALIEAMSRGVPSLGTRVGGITELLESSYIFSNSRYNIDEICDILKKMDNEKLKSQASRNYNQAQKYNKNIIEALRSELYKDFCGRRE